MSICGYAAPCSHGLLLLTLSRFSQDEPITMLAPAMVGIFPLRINDGSLPHLHNAVARQKANFPGSIQDLNVRPLIPVMMDVVCDLTEKYSLRPQYPVSLSQERRKGVGKRIATL